MYIKFKNNPYLEKGIKQIGEYDFTSFNERTWGIFCDNIMQYLPKDYQVEPTIIISASKDKMPKANLTFYSAKYDNTYINLKLNPFEVFALTKEGIYKPHKEMSYEWERVMYLSFKDAYLEAKERYFSSNGCNK